MMDDACFACGKANDNGLKLNISEKDDGVWATIEPPAWSQGYHRLVHGGIIATILDEMAVWAAVRDRATHHADQRTNAPRTNLHGARPSAAC
jgi:hypothetical protein